MYVLSEVDLVLTDGETVLLIVSLEPALRGGLVRHGLLPDIANFFKCLVHQQVVPIS